MLILRTIFALLLCASMIVSAAPATPELARAMPAAEEVATGCCGGKPDQHHDRPCHTTSCVMQCCRLLPVQADARPVLTQTFLVARAEALPPVTLHTLTDPDAIFHPPKA